MSEIQPLWTRDPVASNVRAELARRGIAVNRLPRLVGQNQSYWARRTGGHTEFSASDLIALAGLLEVHPGLFFAGTTKPLADDIDEGRAVRRQGLEPRTRYIRDTRSQNVLHLTDLADLDPETEDSEVEAGPDAQVVAFPAWRAQPGVIRAHQ